MQNAANLVSSGNALSPVYCTIVGICKVNKMLVSVSIAGLFGFGTDRQTHKALAVESPSNEEEPMVLFLSLFLSLSLPQPLYTSLSHTLPRTLACFSVSNYCLPS